MLGQSNQCVAPDRQGPADRGNRQRVDNGADDFGILEQFDIVIEREHIEEVDAQAPTRNKRAQYKPHHRQHHCAGEPTGDQQKSRPAPGPQRNQIGPHTFAAHRDEALRGPQQQTLDKDQRQGHGNDHHHHHRHQLIGRHTQLVGEFIKIGRQHQQALRIAKDQR